VNIETVWKKVREGDLTAFGVLYGKFFSGMCRYAAHLLNDRFLAEETVQDIFLKLWETRGQVYVQGFSLHAYLYRITHNQCMDILKKNKNSIVRLLPSDEWASIAEKYGYDDYLVERMEADETAAQIDRIVEQLPAQCREIFRLSRNEEKTNAEIARQLGLSESTVRVQLYRAVQKIRKDLLYE
jgi:RNA polymerase sigma-70 factor (ECF subfamily)